MSDKAQVHMQQVLDALGLGADPEMAATAERFTRFLAELAEQPSRPALSVCASSMPGQMVAARSMPFYSLCAHHLLPFFGTVDVAYRAADQLVGLGALPRVVQWAARRPQLQERLGQEIQEALVEGAAPRGVIVRVRARHMCVEMRGARSPADVLTVTSAGELDGLQELLD